MYHRRLKAKVPIVRSNSLPRMSYPHMASSDVEIDQQGFSSVDRIFPTTAFSPYLAQGEAQSQRPYESNYEFSSRHSAFDVNSDAPTSLVLRSIISDIPKGVSSGTSTLQEERIQTDVAVDLSGHVAKENQNQHQTYKRLTRSEYLTLYRAALKGNWQEAKRRLEADPDAIRYSIAEASETILHIACASKHTAFVKELVQFLTPEDLEGKDINGYTALCFAAQLGIVVIAKEMVKKSANLPLIRSSEGRTPLHIAALLGRRDMVSYLFSVTPLKDLTPDERMEILVATITYDMYDIALKILDKDETLETANKRTLALRDLARKPFAIGSTSHLSLWKRCLNSC
uniref:Uncharacterized protein n=1 Tax=Quercus lobata TaxID=97700 RepID=A0A7N2MW85_QUELO